MCVVQNWRLTASLKNPQNNRRNQGSALGYLGQPATKTDQHGSYERFHK